MLYGTEYWEMRCQQEQKLSAQEMEMLRRMNKDMIEASAKQKMLIKWKNVQLKDV